MASIPPPVEQKYSPWTLLAQMLMQFDDDSNVPVSPKTVFVGLMSSSIMVTDVLVHCAAYIHHPEFQGHSTTMPGN